MNIFERYLSLWVVLCIVVGVVLGYQFPNAFQNSNKLGRNTDGAV